MLNRLSVVVLASLALACSSDAPLLRVSTEGTSFDRTSATSTSSYASVPFDVRNVGYESAWIPACGRAVMVIVQRWVNNQWVEYNGNACIAVLPMEPIVLRSGESTASAFQITDAGRFRFAVSYSVGAGQTGDERRSYSNSFEVR